MKNIITQKQVVEVLNALDDAIAQGPWQSSNFLKIIGKDLQKIRDDFAEHVSAPTPEKAKEDADQARRQERRSAQKKVFIGLYSSTGQSLHSWERILANLPKQVISRPIYEQEEDVKNLIKTKENQVNEAYVSMFVDPNDILPVKTDKVVTDKLGKPLIALKNKAASTENIHYFVHKSITYEYKRGRLLKLPE